MSKDNSVEAIECRLEILEGRAELAKKALRQAESKVRNEKFELRDAKERAAIEACDIEAGNVFEHNGARFVALSFHLQRNGELQVVCCRLLSRGGTGKQVHAVPASESRLIL